MNTTTIDSCKFVEISSRYRAAKAFSSHPLPAALSSTLMSVTPLHAEPLKTPAIDSAHLLAERARLIDILQKKSRGLKMAPAPSLQTKIRQPPPRSPKLATPLPLTHWAPNPPSNAH